MLGYLCANGIHPRNTRTMWEIYSKFSIKTQERHHRRLSDVFSVNFEEISHCSGVSIANLKQKNQRQGSVSRWPTSSVKSCFTDVRISNNESFETALSG